MGTMQVRAATTDGSVPLQVETLLQAVPATLAISIKYAEMTDPSLLGAVQVMLTPPVAGSMLVTAESGAAGAQAAWM
jgi:hypothetical protein